MPIKTTNDDRRFKKLGQVTQVVAKRNMLEYEDFEAHGRLDS